MAPGRLEPQSGATGKQHIQEREDTGLKGPDANTAVMQDFGLSDHSGRQKAVRILS